LLSFKFGEFKYANRPLIAIKHRNIKYITMLLIGNPIVETKKSNDLCNIDKFF
jgi:hypothetical protein